MKNAPTITGPAPTAFSSLKRGDIFTVPGEGLTKYRKTTASHARSGNVSFPFSADELVLPVADRKVAYAEAMGVLNGAAQDQPSPSILCQAAELLRLHGYGDVATRLLRK